MKTPSIELVLTALFVMFVAKTVSVGKEMRELHSYKTTVEDHIEVCEENLPRNETCSLTAIPTDKYLPTGTPFEERLEQWTKK